MFPFSVLHLRPSVSDKFHHFFTIFFATLEYHVPTWVLKLGTIDILFMLKSQTFKHWWAIPLYCQIFGGSERFLRIHGFKGTGYMVSNLGYRVHGFELRIQGTHFEGTGYLVLRVWGLLFQGYGYVVSHYPTLMQSDILS